MKKIIIFLTVIFCIGCAANNRSSMEAGTMENNVILTLGATKDLGGMLSPLDGNLQITWSSSDPHIVSVDENGRIRALNYSEGGSSLFIDGPARGEAIITAQTPDGSFTQSFEVTVTTEALVGMDVLPPLKDSFAGYFLIGNIVASVRGANSEIRGSGNSAEIINPHLLRHYNALTAENHMKPSYLTNGRNPVTGEIYWSWEDADNFVNAAYNSGFKVIGHTLLWHSQIPQWQTDIAFMEREEALVIMREYISTIVSRYAGKIHGWDVLNEIFPDGVPETADWRTIMRTNGEGQTANPWYASIGSDFVYEGFLAARLADPGAILYYNDYNTNHNGKAAMIFNMVRDINERYWQEYGNEEHSNFGRRALIEGIGMQEHHNTGEFSERTRTTINLFRQLPGVILSITEMDLLAQSWSEFRSTVGSGTNRHENSGVRNFGLINQARFYYEYMSIYLENHDIIERVSFWGIRDSQSWRSGGLPLLFDHNYRAKPAYYRLMEALKNFN